MKHTHTLRLEGHWNRVPVNKMFIEQNSPEPKVEVMVPMYACAQQNILGDTSQHTKEGQDLPIACARAHRDAIKVYFYVRSI